MDFTFLNKEQIWGDRALDVMKKCGTAVAPTDLTVILGGFMNRADCTKFRADGTTSSEGDLTCISWSASSGGYGSVSCVGCGGLDGWLRAGRRTVSARPALPPSEASKISPSKARFIDGIRVVEYGQYPQTVADEHTSEKLERLHSSRSLRLSGKNYTFDSVGLADDDTPFKATSYPEYEMDGKRYIRVLRRPYSSKWDIRELLLGSHNILSTGEVVEFGKPYWVEVQPIEWLIDPSGTMVAKKCLFAGIQFDTKEDYDGDFSKTFMKHYLDTYFAKEMEPTERVAARTVSRDDEEEPERKEPVKKKEPTERVAARTVSRDDEEEGTRTIRSIIRWFRKSR